MKKFSLEVPQWDNNRFVTETNLLSYALLQAIELAPQVDRCEIYKVISYNLPFGYKLSKRQLVYASD